jgi:hypothetical protein
MQNYVQTYTSDKGFLDGILTYFILEMKADRFTTNTKQEVYITVQSLHFQARGDRQMILHRTIKNITGIYSRVESNLHHY